MLARTEQTNVESVYASAPDCEALLTALTQRAGELGYSFQTLEDASGLARGHVGKLLGPSRTRNISIDTLFLLLPALGLRLCVAVDEEAAARYSGRALPRVSMQARPNNNASRVSKRVLSRANRHLSQLATKARWSGKSAQERAQHARMMAMKRWHPTWNEIKSAIRNET